MSKTDTVVKKRSVLSEEQQALLERRLRRNLPAANVIETPTNTNGDCRRVIANWPVQGPLPVDWNRLVEAGLTQAQLLPEAFDFAQWSAYESWFDQYCLVNISITLHRMGIFTQRNEVHTVDELVFRLQILPSYRKLVYRWLQELTEAGLLRREGNGFTNPQPLPTERLDVPWTDTGDIRQSVCDGIIDIITGKKHAVEYFFTGGSASAVEWGYQTGAAAQYLNSIIAAIVKEVADSVPAEREFRALEIGAGIGGTTALLLSVLPPARSAYVYTDLSTYFLDHAKSKFKQYEFIHYDRFDINQDPIAHGYRSNSFDLVMAANVMHCASFLDRTLPHMKSLLAPGGLLLMLEITRNRPCQMIFPGVLEGFSHFEDHRLQTNKPLLTAGEWKSVLQSNGFREFAALPQDDSPASALGQHVILAQSI